jgi:hypothetical protein
MPDQNDPGDHPNSTTNVANKKPRVVVAIPSTGKIHNACMTSVQAMIHGTAEAELIGYWWQNDQPHDACRNALIRRFLADPQWTHLLFLDTDIVVEADVLDRLLAHHAPIVCAPAPIVHRRPSPARAPTGLTIGSNIMFFEDPDRRGSAIEPEALNINYKQSDPDDWPNHPFTCDAAGFGVTLIQRNVLESLEAPWCKFVGHLAGERVGEDFYFFRKARAAGYEILVDPTIPVDHYKEIDLTHLDLLYAEAPPFSPWPSQQAPRLDRNIFVAVRVPPTGWLDVRTPQVLAHWEHTLGARVHIERVFADTVRGTMVAIAERLKSIHDRFTHVLVIGNDVHPHEATIPLLAAVNAPIASALTRTLCGSRICWSFWTEDTFTGELIAPQNIDLPSIAGPFPVAAIDPACALIERSAFPLVATALKLVDHSPSADEQFLHRWCQSVTTSAGRPILQAPFTIERRAEVGLLGLLNLKMRFKAQLREQQQRATNNAATEV